MEKDPRLVKRGRAARLRGQRAEREVCDILTRITGEKYRRNLGQARDSGSDVDYGVWLLEVKFQNRLKMPEWQEQVEKAASGRGRLPAVVFRRDGGKWWIATPFEEFVQVFNALKEAQNPKPSDGGTDTGVDPS